MEISQPWLPQYCTQEKNNVKKQYSRDGKPRKKDQRRHLLAQDAQKLLLLWKNNRPVLGLQLLLVVLEPLIQSSNQLPSLLLFGLGYVGKDLRLVLIEHPCGLSYALHHPSRLSLPQSVTITN
jgi:hypothetical protein